MFNYIFKFFKIFSIMLISFSSIFNYILLSLLEVENQVKKLSIICFFLKYQGKLEEESNFI